MTDLPEPDANGWYDISSAPRDGTAFLAFGRYRYEGDPDDTEYTEIAWFSGDPAWPWETLDGQSAPSFFSHWKPLGPGPVSGGAS